MRLNTYIHFVTLVVGLLLSVVSNTGLAEPAPMMSPSPVNAKPAKSFQQKPQVLPIDQIEISKPPDGEYFGPAYPALWYSDHSLNFFSGYATGVFDTDKKTEKTWILGIGRTNYNSDNTAQEFGLEITNLNLLGVNLGFKWLSDGLPLEPFYKLSLAAYYDPADGLGNFINYKRYLLRGSIGFENLFHRHRRLRLELAAGVGTQGVTGMADLIYAIPD